MKRNEYINNATGKIFNPYAKKAVQYELEDHISLNENFQKEQGCPENEAEENAVLNMGSPEDIADALGELHNGFNSSVIDVLGAVIWVASLLGTSYLLYKTAYGDIGGNILMLSLVLLFSALYFVLSAATFSRMKKSGIIANLIGGIATSAFQLFCFADIQRLNAGGIKDFFALMLKAKISDTVIQNANALSAIPAGIFLLIVIAVSVLQTVLVKRYNNCDFTKKDRSLKKLLVKLAYLLSALSLLVGLFAGFRFYEFTVKLKNDYINDFNIILDIAEDCETLDDVADYVDKNNIAVTPVKNGDKITGYTYIHNIAKAEIIIQPPAEGTDTASVELVFSMLDDDLRDLLLANNDYLINFGMASPAKFKDIEHSVSLLNMRVSGETLEYLYDVQSRDNMTNEQKWTFFGNMVVNKASIKPSKNKKVYDTELCLTYITGFGNNQFPTEINSTIYSERYLAAVNKINEIKAAIESNNDITIDELSKMFKVDVIPPKMTYSEYKKELRLMDDLGLGAFGYEAGKPEKEIKKLYQMEYEYKVNDELSYKIFQSKSEGVTNTEICFFSRKPLAFYGEYSYPATDAEGKRNYVAENIEVGVYKVKTPTGYYSSKGVAYTSVMSIPYFDKKGHRYDVVIKEGDADCLYYLIGTKGNKYKYKICYIDENGYIAFDTKNEFKQIPTTAREAVRKYKDSKGNVYTKIFETSWDENGELLNYNDYV